MPDLKETKKFTFTVEGDTEKWYLEWLAKEINACEEANFKASIIVKVQQNPSKFAKSQNTISTPSVVHFCDVESNDMSHHKRFVGILDQIAQANKIGKKIKYGLGYSNYTFELWIVLHKVSCNSPLTHRLQYLLYINKAFDESFEDMEHFKKEDNFKRCLSKLTIADVRTAISKSKRIMENNESDPGKVPVFYKKFKYYEENPALTVWEHIEKILDECGA